MHCRWIPIEATQPWSQLRPTWNASRAETSVDSNQGWLGLALHCTQGQVVVSLADPSWPKGGIFWSAILLGFPGHSKLRYPSALPSVYLTFRYILVMFGGHHLVFSQDLSSWSHRFTGQAHGSYADFSRHKHQVAGPLASVDLLGLWLSRHHWAHQARWISVQISAERTNPGQLASLACGEARCLAEAAHLELHIWNSVHLRIAVCKFNGFLSCSCKVWPDFPETGWPKGELGSQLIHEINVHCTRSDHGRSFSIAPGVDCIGWWIFMLEMSKAAALQQIRLCDVGARDRRKRLPPARFQFNKFHSCLLPQSSRANGRVCSLKESNLWKSTAWSLLSLRRLCSAKFRSLNESDSFEVTAAWLQGDHKLSWATRLFFFELDFQPGLGVCHGNTSPIWSEVAAATVAAGSVIIWRGCHGIQGLADVLSSSNIASRRSSLNTFWGRTASIFQNWNAIGIVAGHPKSSVPGQAGLAAGRLGCLRADCLGTRAQGCQGCEQCGLGPGTWSS